MFIKILVEEGEGAKRHLLRILCPTKFRWHLYWSHCWRRRSISAENRSSAPGPWRKRIVSAALSPWRRRIVSAAPPPSRRSSSGGSQTTDQNPSESPPTDATLAYEKMIILHKNIFNPFEVRKDKLAVLSKTCVQTNTEFLVKDDLVLWFYCVSTQKRLRIRWIY